jgi:hypothetical protein
MKAFLRNYATPLSLVLFLATGITGVMLFLGIRNHQLGEVHEWVGIGFVVVAILHFFRNGRAMTMMLREPRSKFVIGILGTLTLVIIVGAALSGPGGGPRGPHHGPYAAQRR